MSDFTKSVLVLGGGIAGLSAARALNDRGIAVQLVEKSDHLGGKALDWACMATDTCENCGACLVAEYIDQVKGSPNINVLTETQPSSLKPKGNGFEAVLNGNTEKTINTDRKSTRLNSSHYS